MSIYSNTSLGSQLVIFLAIYTDATELQIVCHMAQMLLVVVQYLFFYDFGGGIEVLPTNWIFRRKF